MQDGLEQELAYSVIIPEDKCEDLRKFLLYTLRPEKKEITLQDLTNKFVLNNYCASTFDVMKEKVLQHKIPESQIETMRNLYELESITKANDISKFRYPITVIRYLLSLDRTLQMNCTSRRAPSMNTRTMFMMCSYKRRAYPVLI